MRPNQNLTRCSKKIPKVGTTCPNQPSAASKPLIRLTPNLVKSRKASQTAQVGLARSRSGTGERAAAGPPVLRLPLPAIAVLPKLSFVKVFAPGPGGRFTGKAHVFISSDDPALCAPVLVPILLGFQR